MRSTSSALLAICCNSPSAALVCVAKIIDANAADPDQLQ
jgi:hypothetical protein